MDSPKPAYLHVWQELSIQKIPILMQATRPQQLCTIMQQNLAASGCSIEHQDAATAPERVCRSYPDKDRLAGSYKLLLLLLLALILLLKLQALRVSYLCFGIGLHELFVHSCMLTLYLFEITGPAWTDLPSEQHCCLTASCFHVDWH